MNINGTLGSQNLKFSIVFKGVRKNYEKNGKTGIFTQNQV